LEDIEELETNRERVTIEAMELSQKQARHADGGHKPKGA